MFYRVLKEHDFTTQTGTKVRKAVGEIVEVMTRVDAERLIAKGVIGSWKTSYREKLKVSSPAGSYERVKRVGIWLITSQHYSGGRVHLYQIGLALAQLGADVYLITDALPKWKRDYPEHPRLRIVMEGEKVPADLDVIITDCKGKYGEKAVDWKQSNPHVPFVCINFETPNWVEKFAPEYAKAMPNTREVFRHADYLIANSLESAKYLREWMGKDGSCPIGVLLPAVNTYALELSRNITSPAHPRPYAVWSARSAKYKGGDVAIEAVMELPFAFDLMMIGQPPEAVKSTDLHKVVKLEQVTDVDKYTLMRDAALVLAPSLFEGAGMVPMEALCSGAPCVVYDLPVLREIYGDSLLYAKWGDREDYKLTVKQAAESVLGKDSEGAQPDIRDVVEAGTEDAIAAWGHEAMVKAVDSLPYLATSRKSVTAQMICYYGPTVQEALASVYPHVDQIVIAHGPTELWKDVPPDNSLELIRSFPDPEKKILLETRPLWKDKLEMRDWCGRHATGNYMLIVDADEIFDGLDRWIAQDIDFGCPTWVHFWHDAEHYVVDAPGMLRWGEPLSRGSRHWHYRWSIWRGSYRFKKHCMAYDSNDNALSHKNQTVDAVKKCPDCRIYHLGHVLPPDLMDSKHQFYIKRDGDDAARRARRKAWHEWNGKLGDCGDGVIKAVNWELPELVRKAFERIGNGESHQ
jgi:glycosyltransferase involved in cell wall biosynthesis